MKFTYHICTSQLIDPFHFQHSYCNTQNIMPCYEEIAIKFGEHNQSPTEMNHFNFSECTVILSCFGFKEVCNYYRST